MTCHFGRLIPDQLKRVFLMFSGGCGASSAGAVFEWQTLVFKQVINTGRLMPADWQPPSERVNLMDAYPGFLEFVTSRGSKSSNWYKTPKADKVLGVPVSATWAW